MDVRLLSAMIKELMLDADSLSLPGIGTFTAEDMPASFSDRGYTINPPYRRLSFSSRQTDDGKLAALYAAGNSSLPSRDAEAIINSFCATLGEDLASRRTVDFPGLGRLRSTKEGHLFFVPAPDLDISPDACGLGPVSLKTHALSAASLPEVDPALIPEAKAQTPLPEAPETTPASSSTPAASAAPTAPHNPETAPAPRPRKPRSAAFKWTAGLAGAAAVLLAAFVVVSRLAPDFTDKLLYTPEQLEILNTPIDGTGLPG